MRVNFTSICWYIKKPSQLLQLLNYFRRIYPPLSLNLILKGSIPFFLLYWASQLTYLYWMTLAARLIERNREGALKPARSDCYNCIAVVRICQFSSNGKNKKPTIGLAQISSMPSDIVCLHLDRSLVSGGIESWVWELIYCENFPAE